MQIFCHFILLPLFYLTSCYHRSVAKITDEYIEVERPGQIFGLIELKDVIIDSILGYPIKSEDVSADTIVERKSKKQIDASASAKVYFNKKHRKYVWQIQDQPSLASLRYSDTIHIKPNTWYRLTAERYRYDVFFYLDEDKGVYMTRSRPDPGAY